MVLEEEEEAAGAESAFLLRPLFDGESDPLAAGFSFFGFGFGSVSGASPASTLRWFSISKFRFFASFNSARTFLSSSSWAFFDSRSSLRFLISSRSLAFSALRFWRYSISLKMDCA